MLILLMYLSYVVSGDTTHRVGRQEAIRVQIVTVLDICRLAVVL